MKAYSYIRFSSPEQSKGDSLRRQLDAARAWCAERGLLLDDTLRDLGRSAYKGGHARFGSLRAFLDLVERGEIERGSYLIVESLDRLSREAVLDAAARLFDLIRAGITIVTLSDGQEYSEERLRTDWTPLVISLTVMARAHDESRTKGLRVGKAWSEKRRRAIENGQAMTAACPAWVTLVGGPRSGRYELLPDRAEIVRSIFTDTVAGMGRRAIAKRLNAAGVETWGTGRKQGSRWHDSYIQKILNNPAVFGQFQPLSRLAGGDGTAVVAPISGYYPAAVDEQTFYAAQAASKARGAGKGRTAGDFKNVLSGMVKCGTCGGSMVMINKGQRSSGPKLACGAALANAGCDHRTYYPYYDLEAHILNSIGDEELSVLAVKGDGEVAELQRKLAAEMGARSDLEKELKHLLDLVAATGGVEAVAARVREIDVKVTHATSRVAEIDRRLKRARAASRPTRDILDELFARIYSEEDDVRLRARAAAAQELRQIIRDIYLEPPAMILVILSSGDLLGAPMPTFGAAAKV